MTRLKPYPWIYDKRTGDILDKFGRLLATLKDKSDTATGEIIAAAPEVLHGHEVTRLAVTMILASDQDLSDQTRQALNEIIDHTSDILEGWTT
jgi:hypothetical protein